ncbi:hypothetical protein OHA79_49170 (plasmid) [Streptomyces sp. NBC_00841]|uniref:hypothetical protein n=1 Tax=unclassified Streptomyces TaxID=2593676 RepID=UPI0022597190|nr:MULTISPECIES: hypothetical protein [unclassified Streptomyces]MCX4538707.1 hypothetical protein [Streptomyces sp. NBC_01669]WSA05481.1 hypothetical protein OHA79_49170 [Streptomyces sp. NBC_00841]
MSVAAAQEKLTQLDRPPANRNVVGLGGEADQGETGCDLASRILVCTEGVDPTVPRNALAATAKKFVGEARTGVTMIGIAPGLVPAP